MTNNRATVKYDQFNQPEERGFDMATKFSEWTKKLGQQHFAMADGTSRTLCGMPMLGNNYARDLYDEDKTPCTTCAERMDFIITGEVESEDRWHEDDHNGESLSDRYYEELCYE